MELNKENIKKIIGIITFSLILYFLLLNISVVKSAVDNFFDVISPFLYGAGIAFLLNIPMKLFERKLFKQKNKNRKPSRLKRPVSIILSIISFIIVISLIIKLIIPQLVSVITMFVSQLPGFVYDLKDWAIDLTKQYPDISNQIASLEINWQSITNDILSMASNIAGGILTSSINVITYIIGGVFDSVVALVFAVYILSSKEKLENQFKKIIKAYIPKEKGEYFLEICSLSKKTFYNFIIGQCTEAVILGTLCCIGMLIFRLPYAVTIGVLVGVTALIPVVGAFLGIAIGAILILSISFAKAIGFIVFLIILQQIETNMIYPKVVGSSVGLPGMWVLVAVVVGGSFGGVIGLLLGLPIVSVLYTILRNDVNNKIKENEEKMN